MSVPSLSVQPGSSATALSSSTSSFNSPASTVRLSFLAAPLTRAGPSVYPPASRNALVQLVDALVPSLQSTAIIFYLLLATHPSLVPVYAQAKLIPTAYVRTVSGLHALDASDWHTAVRDLTHPSVSLQDAGFGSKILFVLGNLPAVDVRAEVVLSYWRLGRVELQGAEEKGVVVDALCDESRRIGAREAWALMRAEEDEAVRETLLERVLARCFGGACCSSIRPGLMGLQSTLETSQYLIISSPSSRSPSMTMRTASRAAS